MTTVQAPQSPSAQPSLVPVERSSIRSQSSTVDCGENRSSRTIRSFLRNWMQPLVISSPNSSAAETLRKSPFSKLSISLEVRRSRHLSPADPDPGDIRLGRSIDDFLQGVLALIEVVPEPDRAALRSRVDHHRIELVAFRELSDRQVERDSAAHCGEIKGFAKIDPGPGVAAALGRREGRVDTAFKQARDKNRAAHIVEQRSARAARNIGTQPDMQSLLERGLQREDGAGEISIGKRTMRDARTPRVDRIHIGRADQVGMRQHRVAAKQPEAIEAFGVGDAVPFEHIAVFPIAFRTMGLNVAIASLCERAERFKRCISAGRNEARRYNGPYKPCCIIRMARDVTDQVFRAAQRCIGRCIAVIVRTLVGIVHHDLADQRALAGLKAGFGEDARGLLMNGRKIKRRCCAIGNEVIDQQAIALPRKGGIGIARFKRKSVFLQPYLERNVECAAELRVLRRMDMQIDEPRQQIRAVRQGHKQPRRRLLLLILRVVLLIGAMDGNNVAIIADRNQGILEEIDLAESGGMKARCNEGLAAQMIHKKSHAPPELLSPALWHRLGLAVPSDRWHDPMMIQLY